MPVKKFKDPSQFKPTEKGLFKKSLKVPKSDTASGSELASSDGKSLTIRQNGNGLALLPSSSTSPTPRYNKEYLKERWTTLSGVIMTYLLEVVDQNTGRLRLHNLLDESKLKDIGIMAGIATEKVLLMSGQPTQIIAETQHKKLDELMPVLLEEVKRRGASVELTERKAEIKLDQK